MAFSTLIKELCIFENGVDYYTAQFLRQSFILIKDMCISLWLGYKKHTISDFKSFIENFSVFYAINSISDINTFNITKRAFGISSRLQIDEYFKNMELKMEAYKMRK